MPDSEVPLWRCNCACHHGTKVMHATDCCEYTELLFADAMMEDGMRRTHFRKEAHDRAVPH